VSTLNRIALIGFGEVGQTLAEDLTGKAALSAWDIAFADPDSLPSRAITRHQVRAGRDATDAVRDADLVISAVTADQDLAAARSVGAGLPKGAFFLDLNSCSPGQKAASAEAVEGAGGRYVEAAVMSPIGPRRIASPMLLGGPHARAFAAAADGLGFTRATAYSEQIGQAAATKLCRSVMIKGVEALLTESLLAARHYGVEQVVLDSLSDLLPLPDWNKTAQYMISRSLEHGTRRAEEMREAARTVEEAGVAAPMSHAIAERQDWAAAYKGALSDDLKAMLDAINADLVPPSA
jgi:3-hydroxyisobutyrate dehydrogenase-like beta-hydroxyacid dehydrogenase